MPIFKQDIQNTTSTKNCPSNLWVSQLNLVSKSVDFGNESELSDEKKKILNEVIKGVAEVEVDETNSNFRDVFTCNDEFYENGDGCCIIEEGNDLKNKCKKDHSTGISFSIVKEGESTSKKYNICHSHPIQTLFDSFFDDPNKIVKFFKLLAIWIVTLMITAVIGTCYEFWIRYGSSIDCIYYKVQCNYNSKHSTLTSNELSIIDFIFPSELGYYPYQKCEKLCKDKKDKFIKDLTGGNSMIGGEKGFIKSNFTNFYHTGRKCITIKDKNLENNCYRPFPYSLIDRSNENIHSSIIKTIIRVFVLFFMFPVLFTRKFLNFSLTKISESYNELVVKKSNSIIGNIIFLFLTGLIFPIISYIIGNSKFNSGSLWILAFVLFLSSIIISFSPLAILFIVLHPDKKNIFPKFDDEKLKNLSIKGGDYFYKLTSKNESDKKISPLRFAFNIIKNILLIPILIIMVLFCLLAMGFSTILSMFYMTFSIIFNFFYLPLSNPLESLDILTNHADLLIILFCIGIIGSSSKSFHIHTTGIMSIILVIIIFFKVTNSLTK